MGMTVNERTSITLRTAAVAAVALLALAGCGGVKSTAVSNGALPETLRQAVHRGKDLFYHPTFGGNGRTCETCHSAGGTTAGRAPNGMKLPSLMNAAAIFPRVHGNGVWTLEDQLTHCVKAGLHGTPPAYDSNAMRDLVTYITSLAQGKPIDMGATP
ncbi:MAG: c-type cytochrome [Vulcanimicrobiaceae bacterium]